MFISRRLGAICLFLLVSCVALAQEQTDKPKSGWGGEAEVGILMTRGNTHTDTQNIKLGVHYRSGPWLHNLKLESLYAQDRGVVSADRFSADFRSNYELSAKAYAFGFLRHENDRFSGFTQRNTEVVGYGRKLYQKKIFHWDAEIGAGARQTKYTDFTKTDEGIVRLATKLEWQFTPTSDFRQDLFVEAGSANTLTQSSSSLKVKINSSLAMKLSVKVQDNSDVPPGKKHTDTVTAVTLVYDFSG